jgi:light-regulated signal transduction histidine kinase (bacteriophytochrome)
LAHDVAVLSAIHRRQVFVNLLTNAVKFSRTKDTSIIEVGGWNERPRNHLLFKDNGVGFDMKYGNKIFDVFQRHHSPKDFEGTGIDCP